MTMPSFILLGSIVTFYWLTQVQRGVSSHLECWTGVLDPGDGYLAETSPRPVITVYDTIHAQPYVSRGRGGWCNELSTQLEQVSAVVYGLIAAVIGHLHTLMADVNRHVIADDFCFGFNRQVTISRVVLVMCEIVGKY